MATFVLVHSVTGGGWSWKETAGFLRRRGHEVYTPTVTGLGERRHLASPAITLDTHIQDIAAVLKYEQLSAVVLVGHSYGGAVVTGVAELIPERLSQLVYIDGLVLRNGEAVVAAMEAAAERDGHGWYLPSWATDDERSAPALVAPLRQPLTIANPRAARIPRTYVACTRRGDAPILAPLAEIVDRVRAAGWPVVELETDHDPNRSAPEMLATCLDQLGGK